MIKYFLIFMFSLGCSTTCSNGPEIIDFERIEKYNLIETYSET